MRTKVHRFFPSSPADVSGLAAAIAAGEVQPQQIVVILGKTEGNGAINDFSRGLAIMALGRLLGPLLDCAAEEIEDHIVLSFSGGTEGVSCPHYLVFTVDESPAPAWRQGFGLGSGIHALFRPG